LSPLECPAVVDPLILDCIPVPLPQSVMSLRTAWSKPGDHVIDSQTVPGSPTMPGSDPSTYPVVAVGGTFDHLHAGHKILLSMAAWIAEDRVGVGVTGTSSTRHEGLDQQNNCADDALLTKKDNRDVLESLPERIQGVRRFMEFFKPSLTYYIVPINDVRGFTATEPNIQALVVSKETVSGGKAGTYFTVVLMLLRGVLISLVFQVNQGREENGLPPLKIFVIDVISHSSRRLGVEDVEALKQAKMSSTYIRQWIVSRQNRDAGT
jgi:phosphopantetheine adenylyltransferase